MKPEQLHDALNLLPDDLLEAADRKRMQEQKSKVIPFKRYAAMAACFALVLACSLFATGLVSSGGTAKMTNQTSFIGDSLDAAAAQAPETAAPREEPAAVPDVEEAAAETAGSSVTVYRNGEPCTLSADQAAALGQLLSSLSYDRSQVCNCIAEYRLELDAVYEISLTQAHVRCERGQAPLDAQQLETVRGILEMLE